MLKAFAPRQPQLRESTASRSMRAAMVEICFTPQLRRFTETPELRCEAASLAEALQAAFALNPRLRGYVLDDQGAIRPNVAVFVDGRRTLDLQQALQAHSRVAVLQALSGG